MFRQSVPSMSFPALLDLVVAERIVSLASYIEVSQEDFLRVGNPTEDQSAPVRSLAFTGSIVPGQLPPKATGVYHDRLPCVRLTKPYFEGTVFDPALAGRYFRAHAYSVLDLDDPSIGAGEKSDAAAWVCGIAYEGHLSPFFNAIAFDTSTKMHPMRAVRNLGAPSCLFIYQPFADMPFTECSMTLKYNVSKGFYANVGGWVKATDFDYLSALPTAMPKLRLVSGGGQLPSGGSGTVQVALVDADANPLVRSTTLYLEETGGYVPKKRVDVQNGSASFKVMATGLDAGDKFKVKVGFRNYSGVLDVPFEVV